MRQRKFEKQYVFDKARVDAGSFNGEAIISGWFVHLALERTREFIYAIKLDSAVRIGHVVVVSKGFFRPRKRLDFEAQVDVPAIPNMSLIQQLGLPPAPRNARLERGPKENRYIDTDGRWVLILAPGEGEYYEVDDLPDNSPSAAFAGEFHNAIGEILRQHEAKD